MALCLLSIEAVTRAAQANAFPAPSPAASAPAKAAKKPRISESDFPTLGRIVISADMHFCSTFRQRSAIGEPVRNPMADRELRGLARHVAPASIHVRELLVAVRRARRQAGQHGLVRQGGPGGLPGTQDAQTRNEEKQQVLL